MPSPRAQQELEDAIQQLGGLRNAGSRNPEFKQWRQSTLTVVQRLWPGDAVRAERFRRIPFSFPSTKADTKTHREYFERGCAEALQLLKAFLAEVQGMPLESLPDSLPAMPPVGAPPEIPAEPQSPAGAIDPTPASFLSDVRERSVISPIGADVSFERPAPPVDMPVFDDLAASSTVPPAPAAAELLDAPEPPPTKGPPQLPAMPARPTAPKEFAPEDAGGPNPLTLDPVLPPPSPPPTQPVHAEIPAPPSVFPEIPLEAPAPPPAAAPPAAALPRPAAPAPTAAGAPPAGGKSLRATVQRRLKEMLGLDAFEREVRAEPEPPKKPGRAGDGGKDVTAGGRPERPSPQARPAMPAPADPPPPSEAPTDDRSSHQVTSDFLDASPVLRATARPVPARTPIAPSSGLARDVAQAVDKLARMVGNLDVPEERRAQARAMLMGLARELDQDSPRWGVVADSITAVMEFPPLARALLPLLLPELDRAA